MKLENSDQTDENSTDILNENPSYIFIYYVSVKTSPESVCCIVGLMLRSV